MPAKIEVRPSPIHGRGVFAVEDIAQGELITNYVTKDKIYKVDDEKAQVHARCFGYILNGTDGKHVLVGDPESEFDLEHCGFLVNDTYKGNLPDTLDFDANLDALIDYYETGLKRANSTLSEKMHATRDIKKGEEIVTNYGYNYWLTRKHKVLQIPDDLRRICAMCSETPFLRIILEMKERRDVPTFFKLILETTKAMEREQMEKDKEETATS